MHTPDVDRMKSERIGSDQVASVFQKGSQLSQVHTGTVSAIRKFG